MAAKRFSEQTIDRARPAKAEEGRYELWDALLPGFGLRVTASGTKTFFLMYRVAGRQRRMTIGRYTIEFKLAQARAAARLALEKVEAGIDPAEPVKPEPSADPSKLSAASPLSVVLAAWIARKRKPTGRYWDEIEWALNRDLGARLGAKPIGRIERSDVLQMVDAIVDRGARVHANRVLTMTKTFFKWCAERQLVEIDPAAPVSHPTEETARDRVLDIGELGRIWLSAGALGYPFAEIVRLLILTAQRRDEVSGMRWQEIDADRAIWTLPAERAKNGQEHVTALAPAALAVIKTVPRRSTALLFSTTGKTAVSGWSRAKDRLDRLLMAPGDEIGPPTPIAHWTLHDLRRSAATGMAALGVAPHVVEKILNHQSGTIRGVAAIYNRHAYLDERRTALELWAQTLAAAVTPRRHAPASPRA